MAFRVQVFVAIGVVVILASCALAADSPKSVAQEVVAPVGGPVYVVDQNNPKADDSNPGTPAAPWKTIGKAAATAQAGDTVYVMEGDYKEQVKFAHSGAEGQPIVFKGLPRQKAKVGLLGEKGKGTTAFDTTGCNYLRIEGFLIVDADTGVNIAGDHVSVVDNRFEGVQSVPVDVPSSKGDKPAYAYVAFNEIYHSGKGVVSGGSHWLFERNEVTRLFCYDKGDADYTRPFGNHMVFRQNYLHGSTRAEVKKSHTDAFQVFGNNGDVARDILLEENVCGEYDQGLMGTDDDHPQDINNLTFHRNIFFQRGNAKGWAQWGLCFGGMGGLVADGNTFFGGSSGSRGTGCRFDNNLFYNCVYWFDPKTSKDCTGQKNLIYYASDKIPATGLDNLGTPYPWDVLNVNPLFENLSGDNVRLKKGSPAIGAGTNGVTIGALDYPNVYYVDERHAGASDEGFGYPGAPYKTIAKALSVAEAGETVLLRGGIYRETVKPTKAGVTIKAAKDEKVTISGADEISGWKRAGEGAGAEQKWTAPLAAKPTKVLKDGQPFGEFKYDDAAKAISVTGFDPRLCLMETVVRQSAIDLSAAPDTKVEGLTTVDTLGQGEKK